LITGYNLNYYNGAPVYELRKLKKVIKFNSSMSYSAETLVRYMGQATTIIQVGVNGVHRAGSKSITLKNLIGAIKLFLRLINLRILNNL
jgi:hypothetical protein